MKKGYYVYVPEDDGVSIAVVATSSKEAKNIGYKYLHNEYDADFLDVRVKWKRDANVDELPIGIEKNYLTGLVKGIYDYIYGKCDICGANTIVELHYGEGVCKFCREHHLPQPIGKGAT